jgi:hypothetical protein
LKIWLAITLFFYRLPDLLDEEERELLPAGAASDDLLFDLDPTVAFDWRVGVLAGAAFGADRVARGAVLTLAAGLSGAFCLTEGLGVALSGAGVADLRFTSVLLPADGLVAVLAGAATGARRELVDSIPFGLPVLLLFSGVVADLRTTSFSGLTRVPVIVLPVVADGALRAASDLISVAERVALLFVTAVEFLLSVAEPSLTEDL